VKKMATKLYNYFPLFPFKKTEDIDLWSIVDTDVLSFGLDEDRILGEGSAKYVHANNSNQGDITINFPFGVDISDYDYILVWMKTGTSANFDLRLQSTAGNYNQYRLIPTILSSTNVWKVIKVDLSAPTTTSGTFDNTNLTQVMMFSSTANHTVYLNFMAFAYESFEFETDIAMVLQDIATNSSSSNSNLPIIGRTGGITINQGSEDSELNIPVFLKGATAFQKLLQLQLLRMKGYPLLFELENYLFYPIMIDNFSDSNISRETSESSFKTMFDLTIQAHIYNND